MVEEKLQALTDQKSSGPSNKWEPLVDEWESEEPVALGQ